MNGIDTHRLGFGEQRVSVFSQQERYPLFHLGTGLIMVWRETDWNAIHKVERRRSIYSSILYYLRFYSDHGHDYRYDVDDDDDGTAYVVVVAHTVRPKVWYTS